MSDEEVIRHYENMKEVFKNDLPNPEHEPLRFAYYVKLYKYFYHGKFTGNRDQ